MGRAELHCLGYTAASRNAMWGRRWMWLGWAGLGWDGEAKDGMERRRMGYLANQTYMGTRDSANTCWYENGVPSFCLSARYLPVVHVSIGVRF